MESKSLPVYLCVVSITRQTFDNMSTLLNKFYHTLFQQKKSVNEFGATNGLLTKLYPIIGVAVLCNKDILKK